MEKHQGILLNDYINIRKVLRCKLTGGADRSRKRAEAMRRTLEAFTSMKGVASDGARDKVAKAVQRALQDMQHKVASHDKTHYFNQ